MKSGVTVLSLLAIILILVTMAAATESIDLWRIAEAKLYSDFFSQRNSGLSLSSENDYSTGVSNISLHYYQFPQISPSSTASSTQDTTTTQPSYESSLTIFGRKVIGVRYKQTHYLDSTGTEMEPREPTSEIDIEQELQVKVKGEVGKKIFANVDYDDTLPQSEQQKISLKYLGDEKELIQEVAIGDIQSAWRDSQFLSYNQSLFGVRVKAKLGNFNLTGIGSMTRGIPESKTFTGKTASEKREILDTSYLKRKYYRAYFDSSHLPLILGSVEVYIDDQKGTNNEDSLKMTVSGEAGDSYTGYFDKQYPGEDYFLDYEKGVLNFSSLIEENYVIALSYLDKDGTRHPQTGYRMLKKGEEELYIDKYELKNYYYLGSQRIQRDNFLLKILDLSNNDVTSNYEFTIDYEFGILTFISPLPPFPEAYPPLSEHIYTIYVEYRYTIDAYILRPNIIPGSERVYLDGRELTRDIDYQIDYSTGFLSFFPSLEISEFSQIKIDYEWMPFAGGKMIILGARAEYIPWQQFSLGSTLLSQTAPRSNEVPELDSAPSSQLGVGLDAHYDFSPLLSRAWSGKISPELSFSAELAQSTYNPNTFGRAIIENFESTKISDELSMSKDSWQLASKPVQEGLAQRNTIDINQEEIIGSEINPGWSNEKRRVLVLDYYFDSSREENWDSVVYSLSSTGKDYSERNFLEIWLKGEGKGEFLTLDLGVVSEDVDGDTFLDTEDKNNDGKLNPGEDIGIDLGGRLIGEGNGRLDTEDLDGNGLLDTDENYATYDWIIEPDLRIDWTGWRKLIIPLKDAFNWDEVKSMVKHLRLLIEGDDISGTLKFALISISGDRWRNYDIESRSVNSEDDPEYNPFDDEAFLDYYEAMYGNARTAEGKWKKEGALCLTLAPEGEGWVQQTFAKAYDYTDYKTLNFWIWGDEKGEDFQLRIGSEVRQAGDYYQKEVKIDWQGWRMISVPLAEMTRRGSPSWENIRQLRAGIKNESSDWIKIYLNDIFLSEVGESQGLAKGFSLQGALGTPFSFIAQYKEVDDEFQSLMASSWQGTRLTSLRVNLSPLKFLPLSYYWSRKENSGNSLSGALLESEAVSDKVIEEKKEYKLSFLSSSWPQAIFKLENRFTDDPSRGIKEKEDTYRVSLEYKNPYSFFLLPTFIQTIYQREEKRDEYQEETRNKREITENWHISLPFQLAKNLTLKPIYREKRKSEIEQGEWETPQLKERSFSLESRASFLYLSPSFMWQGGCREDNFSEGDLKERDIFTHSRISLNIPFQLGALFPETSPWKSLRLYGRYESTREVLYEGTTTSFDLCSGLGLKEFVIDNGKTKFILEKENLTLRQRWQPFSFLDLACDYSQQKRREVREDVPYTIEIRVWPSLDLSFNLNKIPGEVGRLSSHLFTSSYLIASYIHRETIKKDISFLQMEQPSLTWRGGFKKPEDLALILSYKSNQKEESYFGQGGISRDSSSHYEAKIDYFALFPEGAKIPFLRRLVNFENKIHLILGLNLETKEGSTGQRIEEDKQKWKLFSEIGYKIEDNIRINLGLEGGYVQDGVRAGEDNYSYGASCQVEIRF